MSHADDWFREQLARMQGRSTPEPVTPRWGFGALHRTHTSLRAKWVRNRSTIIGSCALLAGMGVLASEALHGPMRADQPFGLSAPPAVFRASSMPGVNGHAPRASADDRNKVVTSGIGAMR